MPRSQKVGFGGEVTGSIKINFNKRNQIAGIDIEGKGDCIPMRAIRDSMMLINNAILQARGRRKRSGVVQRREAGILAKKKETARVLKEKKDKREATEKQALIDAKALLKADKEKKDPTPPPAPAAKSDTPITPNKGEK